MQTLVIPPLVPLVVGYLPYFFCYGLWKHTYLCLSERGFFVTQFASKNLCLSYVINVIKKGRWSPEGKLQQSNFGPELQHIWAQLHTLPHMGTDSLPEIAAIQEDPARTGCTALIDSFRGTYPSPHQKIHRSQHGRWVPPCKAPTSENWTERKSRSFALSIYYWEFLTIYSILCNLRFNGKELLKIFMLKKIWASMASDASWTFVFRGWNTRILTWTIPLQRKGRFQVISFSYSSSNVCLIINGNTFA